MMGGIIHVLYGGLFVVFCLIYWCLYTLDKQKKKKRRWAQEAQHNSGNHGGPDAIE